VDWRRFGAALANEMGRTGADQARYCFELGQDPMEVEVRRSPTQIHVTVTEACDGIVLRHGQVFPSLSELEASPLSKWLNSGALRDRAPDLLIRTW
jgi:hypothetical protein